LGQVVDSTVDQKRTFEEVLRMGLSHIHWFVVRKVLFLGRDTPWNEEHVGPEEARAVPEGPEEGSEGARGLSVGLGNFDHKLNAKVRVGLELVGMGLGLGLDLDLF